IVGIDTDDLETLDYLARYEGHVRAITGPAPIGVGSVWNRGAKASDADIIAPFPDDSFPGLPDWDDTICQHLPDPNKIGVIAWNDTANPDQCTLPVITRRWFELCG